MRTPNTGGVTMREVGRIILAALMFSLFPVVKTRSW